MDLAFNSFCDDGTVAISTALLENTTVIDVGHKAAPVELLAIAVA